LVTTLYVISSSAGAGKTMLCAGLGKHFLDGGRRVGFLKPILSQASPLKRMEDSDALFLKKVLALEEPLESISKSVAGGTGQGGWIKEALDELAALKDIVIIEGDEFSEHSIRTVRELGARVIFVEVFSEGLGAAELSGRVRPFGEHLLGVVVNKVPARELPALKSKLAFEASGNGINVLGVLPEDRVLFSLTVAELAEYLGGRIIGGDGKLAELVEHFMLGAMVVGSGNEYFSLKGNKAALVRSERSDMQLAALESETRCLVLSGEAEPLQAVLERARVKEVPIIQVQDDIATLAGKLEAVLGRTKFSEERKLPHLARLLEQYFDFQMLSASLGSTGDSPV